MAESHVKKLSLSVYQNQGDIKLSKYPGEYVNYRWAKALRYDIQLFFQVVRLRRRDRPINLHPAYLLNRDDQPIRYKTLFRPNPGYRRYNALRYITKGWNDKIKKDRYRCGTFYATFSTDTKMEIFSP